MRASGTAASLRAAVTLPWRTQRGTFLGQVLIAVLTGLAPVLAAWLMRAVLDSLTGSGSQSGLLTLVVVLAVAGGLQAVIPYLGQYLAAQSGRAIERHVTVELFTAVGRLPGLRNLEDPGYLDRLNTAQRAGMSGPGQIFTGMTGAVQSALTLSGFLAVLFVLNPVMALIVMAATIPGIFAEFGIARQRAAMFTGLSQSERRQYFYASLLSTSAAAKEIRLFGLGPFFRQRMLGELGTIQHANQAADRRQAMVYSLLAMLSALVAGAGLWWAVSAAARGRMTIGDVSIFIASLAAVATSLNAIITSTAMTFQTALTFGSYQDIVHGTPDLPLSAEPVPAPPLQHGIEFEDVWFRYGPDRPWVLRGVSFVVPSGQTVALVGRNGAGKSTLVKLLCRFYDPDRGRIRWDGVDLRDLDLAGLRDRISTVFQDYMSYDLTARENIAVGDLSLSRRDEAVTDAARQAGLHQVLTTLPKGYDTLLTRSYFDLADKADPQTGVFLSGGQWQRIALARALLRGGRDLMILDEPSSGLDAEAEHEIHTRLHARRDGYTTVLISHRLNAIRDADRILVLVDGMLAEQGSHAALMARAGTYARLFSLQARGFADVGAESLAVAGAGDG